MCQKENKTARKMGFGVFGNGGDKEPAKKERFGVKCIGGRTNTTSFAPNARFPTFPISPPPPPPPPLSMSSVCDIVVYLCKHGAVFTVECNVNSGQYSL